MYFIKFLCRKRSIATIIFLHATQITTNYSFGAVPKLTSRTVAAKGLSKRKNVLSNNLPRAGFKPLGKPAAIAANFTSAQANALSKKTIPEVQETTITFAEQNINTKSAAQFFTIRGSKLTADVTVSTNPPFSISKDSIVYEPLLIYTIEELASNQTVYVRFNPTASGNYTDSVISISEGADNKIVTLSGTAVAKGRMLHGNRLAANNIVSPNGDGINDTWAIKNIEDYPNNSVKITDQSGKIIYSKQGYTNDWNGTYNNAPLAQGTYYYVVDFGADSGLFYRGFITIVRD